MHYRTMEFVLQCGHKYPDFHNQAHDILSLKLSYQSKHPAAMINGSNDKSWTALLIRILSIIIIDDG